MKFMQFALLSTLAACSALETRPVKVTEVFPPGSNRPTSSQTTRSSSDGRATSPVLELKVGQQWTYRRVDLWRNQETERFRQELVFAEAGRWMVRWTILNSDDAQRRGSITGELFDPASHGFADGKISGNHFPLRFPLNPGKSWSFDYAVHGNTRDVKIKQTAVVRGWEQVRVPAGSFRALRVEHEGLYSATEAGFSWNGKIRETYWYAPEVGRVVMREYRDTKGDGGPWDQWRDELVAMRL